MTADNRIEDIPLLLPGDSERLQEILQWSIAAQGPSRPGRDRDRANILDIREGKKTDAQVMCESRDILEDQSTNTEEKELALDNLLQLVDLIDNANSLDKFGVHEALREQFESEYESIRSGALWVEATAMQNNNTCQAHVMNHGMLKDFMKLATDDNSFEVRTRAVSAISAFFDDNAEHAKYVANVGGVELLIMLGNDRSAENASLAFKVCHVLSKLLRLYPESIESLSKNVSSIISMLSFDGLQLRVTCVNLLNSILTVSKDHDKEAVMSALQENDVRAIAEQCAQELDYDDASVRDLIHTLN
eukprot:Clim_evm5s164 gene=Clim_evmTU5s164